MNLKYSNGLIINSNMIHNNTGHYSTSITNQLSIINIKQFVMVHGVRVHFRDLSILLRLPAVSMPHTENSLSTKPCKAGADALLVT